MRRLTTTPHGKLPPRGRPALPPHEKRSLVVEVAVNEAERARLTRLASARGLPLAVFVRDASLGLPLPRAASAGTLDPAALDAVNKLWLASSAMRRELSPLANNVNQLAHHANAGRYRQPSVELALQEINPLLERLKRLEAEAERLVATIAREDEP